MASQAQIDANRRNAKRSTGPKANACAKLKTKGCDWIVANDVTEGGTLGGGDNAVAIVSKAGIERWERMAKDEVARRLALRIAQEFQ